MLEIRKGSVSILIREPEYDGTFRFFGLVLSSQPMTVYVPHIHSWYGWEHDEEVPEKRMIAIGDYLTSKLKKQADEELKAFLDKNIGIMDFYHQKDEWGQCTFWQKTGYWDEYEEKQGAVNLTFSQITEGIVHGEIEDTKFVYDFIQDKFTEIRSDYGDRKPLTPLEIFYGGHNLHERLAMEQLKRGVAHPAFAEMVNINKFLKGKKSVKLGLQGGHVHEFKGPHLHVRSIIDIIGNTFYVNNDYWLKPRLDSRLPIANLEYLQYAKKIYRVNTGNLVIE